MKNKSGFGLIEIIIVMALLALLVSSGWYFGQLKQDVQTKQTGAQAEKQAQELRDTINKQSQEQQKQSNLLK